MTQENSIKIKELDITSKGTLKLLKSERSMLDVNPSRVASCRGYLRFHPKTAGVIEMRSIFVSEEYRQKGYGTKFIKWLERWCRKEGYNMIFTKTTLDRTCVFGKFLIKRGFNYKVDEALGSGWRKKI